RGIVFGEIDVLVALLDLPAETAGGVADDIDVAVRVHHGRLRGRYARIRRGRCVERRLRRAREIAELDDAAGFVAVRRCAGVARKIDRGRRRGSGKRDLLRTTGLDLQAEGLLRQWIGVGFFVGVGARRSAGRAAGVGRGCGRIGRSVVDDGAIDAGGEAGAGE